MSKYQIHYIAAGNESGSYGGVTVIAEVEGACFSTQSTNGAGLVCDVFGDNSTSQPSHTFSNVQRISKVVTNWDCTVSITKGEAFDLLLTYQTHTTFRNSPIDLKLRELLGLSRIEVLFESDSPDFAPEGNLAS